MRQIVFKGCTPRLGFHIALAMITSLPPLEICAKKRLKMRHLIELPTKQPQNKPLGNPARHS